MGLEDLLTPGDVGLEDLLTASKEIEYPQDSGPDPLVAAAAAGSSNIGIIPPLESLPDAFAPAPAATAAASGPDPFAQATAIVPLAPATAAAAAGDADEVFDGLTAAAIDTLGRQEQAKSQNLKVFKLAIWLFSEKGGYVFAPIPANIGTPIKIPQEVFQAALTYLTYWNGPPPPHPHLLNQNTGVSTGKTGNGTCWICGFPIQNGSPWEVEHILGIVPSSRINALADNDLFTQVGFTRDVEHDFFGLSLAKIRNLATSKSTLNDKLGREINWDFLKRVFFNYAPAHQCCNRIKGAINEATNQFVVEEVVNYGNNYFQGNKNNIEALLNRIKKVVIDQEQTPKRVLQSKREGRIFLTNDCQELFPFQDIIASPNWVNERTQFLIDNILINFRTLRLEFNEQEANLHLISAAAQSLSRNLPSKSIQNKESERLIGLPFHGDGKGEHKKNFSVKEALFNKLPFLTEERFAKKGPYILYKYLLQTFSDLGDTVVPDNYDLPEGYVDEIQQGIHSLTDLEKETIDKEYKELRGKYLTSTITVKKKEEKQETKTEKKKDKAFTAAKGRTSRRAPKKGQSKNGKKGGYKKTKKRPKRTNKTRKKY